MNADKDSSWKVLNYDITSLLTCRSMRLNHDALERLKVGFLARQSAYSRGMGSGHDQPARLAPLALFLAEGGTIPEHQGRRHY